MAEVDRAWSRIEAWMDAHAPEARAALRPGASDEAIREAEEALGLELPASFRRSIARHDGQHWRWPSLVEFGILLPLHDVVEEQRSLEQASAESQADADQGNWWRPGWVPFVSRDGDYLSVDLAPDDHPRYGQVWSFLHDDEPMHSLVAPDFGTWLERWADELERGVFALDRAPGSGLVPRGETARSRLWLE